VGEPFGSKATAVEKTTEEGKGKMGGKRGRSKT